MWLPQLGLDDSWIAVPLLVMVFISWDCYNQWMQIGWFKIQMYSFKVLEGRSLRSRCCQGCAPSDSLWNNLFHASLLLCPCCQESLRLSGLQMHLSNLCLHSLMAICFLCVSVSVPFSYFLRTPVVLNLGPTLLQCDLSLI